MKLLLLLLSLPGVSQAAPVTVRSTLLKELVETKNERVLGKEKEKEAAALRDGYFLRSFLPKISAHGAQERFKTGTHPSKDQPAYGIEGSVSLFNGGRDFLESRKRNLVQQRKDYEHKSTRAEELGKARELYWQALYLRDLLVLLKDAGENNEANLKNAARRIQSGVATEADRVEFEMKAVDLKRDLEMARFTLGTRKKQLSAALGLDPEAEIELPEPLNHEHSWEESLAHSHAEHDFFAKPKMLAAQETALEASILSRAFWPKLDAYAGWNQFNEREEDFSSARERRESVLGIRLSLDLFDGWNSQREAAALRAESDAAALEAAYLQREVEIHLSNEIAELKLLHDQVHEAEENTKRAQRYYSLTLSEYGRGVKNSPDVLGAAEKLYDMREKHLAILRDFQIAKSHVLSKIGR